MQSCLSIKRDVCIQLSVWRKRCEFALRRSNDTVRSSPLVILVPLIMFVILAGTGSWAVLWSAALSESAMLSQARAIANSTALALELTLFVNIQPVNVLSLFVRQNPQWGTISARFDRIAASIVTEAAGEGFSNLLPTTLRLVPFDVVSASYPSPDPWFKYENGVDAFIDPARRDALVRTAQLNITTAAWMRNPDRLYVRVPIFIGNVSQTELWGRANDSSMQEYCPPCYRPDLGQKLWGYTSILMDPMDIVNGSFSQLAELANLNFIYKLYRSATVDSTTPDILIGGTADNSMLFQDMYMQLVIVPSSHWFLFIAPVSGWKVTWAAGVVVATVLMSAVASTLLSLVLISRHQHQLLLHSLVPRSVVERVQKGQNFTQTAKLDTPGNTFLHSTTPADKILDMMSQLLKGVNPSMQDVILVRTAMMQSFDLYAPIGMEQRILDTVADANVGAALVALVGRGSKFGLGCRQDSSDLYSGGTPKGKGLSSVMQASCEGGRDSTMSVDEEDLYVQSEMNLRMVLEAIISDDPDGHFLSDRLSSISSTRSSTSNSQNQQVYHRSSATRHSNSSVTSETAPGGLTQPKQVACEDDITAAKARAGTESSTTHAFQQMVIPPSAYLMEEMERQLSTAHSWTFDVFKLDAATNGRPLSALAFYLLSCSGLIQIFHLPTIQLVRFLKEIEDGYSDDNPYHNRKHAADVLQSMHLILHEGGMMATSTSPGYVDDLTLLACYLAAAVHDFEHGGHTNEFLIQSGDELAMTYNDKSPLENHHLASAYTKMNLPATNFLKNLAKRDLHKVRKLLIDLVLATDMKQHFSIVSQFGTLHRLNKNMSGDTANARRTAFASSGRGASMHSLSFSRGHQTMLTHSPSSTSSNALGSDHTTPLTRESSTNRTPLDDAERLLSLQMALKLSDLGHLSAPLPVHLKWVAALEEEFFRQGDAETAYNMPISPLFDRTKPGVTKSQVGFFDVVVLPCVENFTIVFKGCKPMLLATLENYRYWTSSPVVSGAVVDKPSTPLHVPSPNISIHTGRIHITMSALTSPSHQSIAE